MLSSVLYPRHLPALGSFRIMPHESRCFRNLFPKEVLLRLPMFRRDPLHVAIRGQNLAFAPCWDHEPMQLI